jgi:hypothetical protein
MKIGVEEKSWRVSERARRREIGEGESSVVKKFLGK